MRSSYMTALSSCPAEEEYEKMSKAVNPYGNGTCERIADILLR